MAKNYQELRDDLEARVGKKTLEEARKQASEADAIERLREVIGASVQYCEVADDLETVKDALAAYRMEIERLHTAAAEYFREFDHLIGDQDYPERAALRDALRGDVP